MKMIRLMCLAILLLGGNSFAQSQNVQVYDAHLANLQKSIPGWRTQIDEIDPATIVVPYHIGKLIEDNKKVALQNLELVSLYSTNIPAKRSLSAEIDLLGLLKEVHSNMDALSDILLEMVNSDQKKAQTWRERLGAITSGPLNAEEVYQIKAVHDFADQLERRCAGGKN
jgi:hypothetical protein